MKGIITDQAGYSTLAEPQISSYPKSFNITVRGFGNGLAVASKLDNPESLFLPGLPEKGISARRIRSTSRLSAAQSEQHAVRCVAHTTVPSFQYFASIHPQPVQTRASCRLSSWRNRPPTAAKADNFTA